MRLLSRHFQIFINDIRYAEKGHAFVKNDEFQHETNTLYWGS